MCVWVRTSSDTTANVDKPNIILPTDPCDCFINLNDVMRFSTAYTRTSSSSSAYWAMGAFKVSSSAIRSVKGPGKFGREAGKSAIATESDVSDSLSTPGNVPAVAEDNDEEDDEEEDAATGDTLLGGRSAGRLLVSGLDKLRFARD